MNSTHTLQTSTTIHTLSLKQALTTIPFPVLNALMTPQNAIHRGIPTQPHSPLEQLCARKKHHRSRNKQAHPQKPDSSSAHTTRNALITQHTLPLHIPIRALRIAVDPSFCLR